MNAWKEIKAPFESEAIAELRSGDGVLISGVLYTARDKAHQRICEIIKAGEKPPVSLRGQVLYYAGPSPKPPDKVTGSAGPTTSGRMDVFTETILSAGVCATIGKGRRDESVKLLIQRFKAPYLAAFGGAGAYYAKRILSSDIVAFEELGPEAVYKLRVEGFPAVVINDIYGGDLYESA